MTVIMTYCEDIFVLVAFPSSGFRCRSNIWKNTTWQVIEWKPYFSSTHRLRPYKCQKYVSISVPQCNIKGSCKKGKGKHTIRESSRDQGPAALFWLRSHYDVCQLQWESPIILHLRDFYLIIFLFPLYFHLLYNYYCPTFLLLYTFYNRKQFSETKATHTYIQIEID